jgi:hypothetical protein
MTKPNPNLMPKIAVVIPANEKFPKQVLGPFNGTVAAWLWAQENLGETALSIYFLLPWAEA